MPAEGFRRLVGDEAVIRYDFLDPVLYLREQKPDRAFFETLPLDPSRPTVCVREEEHLATYVAERGASISDGLARVDANVVLIPRYAVADARERWPDAIVVEQKLPLSNILPFADAFIGGGGTLNIEAAYWGNNSVPDQHGPQLD